MYLENDFLKRKTDLERLTLIIENTVNNGGGTFALNGKWGSGKTYLINMLKESLSDKYFFITYNAWENNYYEEPLIGILNALTEELEIYITANASAKDIFSKFCSELGNILDFLLSNSINIKPFNAIKKIIKYKRKKKADIYAFNSMKKIQEAKHTVNQALKFVSEIKPVIIVVDELDRCDPSYSLRILERLHHVENNNGKILRIHSVDKTRLEKIINSIYSEGDGGFETPQGYLRK